MSSNEWEQARAYVERLRQKGRTDEQIRQIMLKGGWTEEQVEKILPGEVLRAPSPPAPSPPPPPPAPAPGTVPQWASAAPSRGRPRPSARPVPRPFGVSLLVVLCDIGALLGLIASVLGIVALVGFGGLGEALAMGVLALVLLFAAILINLGILIVGYFLWKGFNWARITFMVLLGLWALQCVPGLLAGLRYGAVGAVALPVLQILVCVLFIVILNGRGAREYCTR